MRLQPITQPGYATDVEFLASKKGLITLGVTLDDALVRTGQYTANKKILKAGTVIAKVTATGLYGPVKKTTVQTNANAGATTVVVANAAFFQVNDNVIIGTEAAKTITAIDYDTNTITVSALVSAQAAGVTVRADNGLETATCILLNTTDLTDGDAAAAAATQAVVLSARLQGYNTLVSTDLTNRFEFR